MAKLDALIHCSEDVAEIRSRSAKIQRLASLIRSLVPKTAALAACYLAGSIPQRALGLGPGSINRIGDVTPAHQTSLRLTDLDRVFGCVAATRGKGATAKRETLIVELLQRATAREQRFLNKLICGELRQGALDALMLEALAVAASVPAEEVHRAWAVTGDIGTIARSALADGIVGLRRFQIELFHPLLPMLAQTAESTDQAMERLGPAAFDHKLDGVRVQVHKDGDEVRVYTRHLNEVTTAVPEIVETVQAWPVRRLILDGEAIALTASGAPEPFQLTMRRFGRKLDIGALRQQLPLTPIFFDCLLVDDQELIGQPLNERWQALLQAVATPHRIPRCVTGEPATAQSFLRAALEQGHEGLVAKRCDETYLAGNRSNAWLKIKPSHTLDLVILAAEWGSGRRKNWLSNLHLGARDPSSNGFVMLGKTFKGLTDTMLSCQTKRLLEIEIARDGPVVHVKPEVVVEIACDGLQTSPHYPGGVALRFARVKSHRTEKCADEADDLQTVLALRAQCAGTT